MTESAPGRESKNEQRPGTVRIEHVDVGYPPDRLDALKVVYLPRQLPYPPEAWLNLDTRSAKWGTLKENKEISQSTETLVSAIQQLLCDNLVIVLPEFAGSDGLTRRLRKLVGEAKKLSCFIIAGSYYAKEGEKKVSKCPVILPNGEVIYQYKFGPSHLEYKYGCVAPDGQPLYVFRNTGIGNFSVVICSDSLPEGNPLKPLQHSLRREEVRQIFVPARNSSSVLPRELSHLSNQEGVIVYYCNGFQSAAADDSRVYVPLRDWSKKDVNPRIEALEVPVGEIFSRYPAHGRERPSRNAPGFQPRPVLWSGRSPIAFRPHMKVLAIGSHFDDVWLGCSATLMLLKENFNAQVVYRDLCDHYPSPYFGYLNLKHDPRRVFEAIDVLCDELGFVDVRFASSSTRTLGDQEFPLHVTELEARVESLYEHFQDADLVFVPRSDDYHQDHVLTAQAVLKKFRDATIFEYEIKEFRRTPFHPSVVVDVGGKSRAPIKWRGAGDNTISLSFAEKKAYILNTMLPDLLGAMRPSSFAREQVLGRMSFRAQEGGLTNAIRPAYAESFASDHVIR